MAITWEVKISNVDVAAKRATVVAIRTDDADADATEIYRFNKVVLDSASDRTSLLNTIWAKHLVSIDDQTAKDDFITNLEQLGKTNLESREV